MSSTENSLVPEKRILGRILVIRGQKVLLDSDLAELYAVETARLNQQVRRNKDKFPEDFMFQLTKAEFDNLKSHFATSSSGWGGRRKLPYFTTIADFITKLPLEIETIFRDVLLICDDMGLIGKQMFAIDGCKLPSNASKEWSGTRKQFKEKKEKMEGVIRRILKKHRDEDSDNQGPPSPDMRKREEQQIETIKRKAKKYKQWLQENTDKPGKRKQPLQSNITDNDSAKLKSSHGVIQGFNGLAISDDKHQVIVC